MGTKITGGGGSTDVAGTGTLAKGVNARAGGTNSQATAASAHAEGNGCFATGIESHAEGSFCSATGQAAHAEGTTATASALSSHAEGQSCTASGQYAHVQNYACIASGEASHCQGRFGLASRLGQTAWSSYEFATEGDAQANLFVASRATTDATPTVLYFGGGGSAVLTGATTNVLTIPINRAHQFRVEVIARRSDVAGDAAGWEFSGVIVRGSSGNAAFVGTVQSQAWGTTGAAAWDVTPTIDTTDATNNYLKITATGEAAKTIRWVARIETVEVG